MVEVYGTAAGWRDYHNARGRDIALFADDDDVNAALLVASEALDGRFMNSFGGLKVGGRDQIREWPRYDVYDIYGNSVPSSAVPREIIAATYELALKELQKPGSLSVDFTPGKYKSVRVEGAVSVDYAQFNSASDIQTDFPIIREILSSLLVGSRNTSPLSGSTGRA